MSELQIGLLAIGIVVVLVMYLYGWWQQRRYHKRYAKAFDAARQDALYGAGAEPGKATNDEIAVVNPDAEPLSTSKPDGSGTQLVASAIHADSVDEFGLPDETIDYLVEFNLSAPMQVEALEPLWQRRFDAGKNVSVAGLDVDGGHWVKLSPESGGTYSAFRIGLQLADRSGPVSEVHLSDFRDLAATLASRLDGTAELPDVAAAVSRAQQLDRFCAEVDQMIGLNILPSGDRLFSGGEIAQMAHRNDMSLDTDGSYHLLDDDENTLFSLGCFDGAPFYSDSIDSLKTDGLTLLLDLPRVARPAERFDAMALLARKIAMDLRANVMDDHRVALGEPGIAQIRSHVSGIEQRMLQGDIIPGSVQARRLFS